MNCHSHLEYAVYAGFGDGLPFSSWIGLHVARKRLLDLDDMRAIATDGAHECLAFRASPRSATAASPARPPRRADATGLRAIVYLEVFGRDASAMERFARAARAGRAGALRPRAPRRLAARAVHLHGRALRGMRRARAAARDPPRRERRRAGVPARRLGRLVGLRRHARATARPDGDPDARRGRAARAGRDGRALRRRRRRRDRAARASTASGSRTARARTGSSAAASRRSGISSPRGSRSASPRTARPRRRRSTCSTSCAPRSSPRARASGARTRSRRDDALELATLGGARVLGLEAERRLARAGQVGRPRRSSRSTDSPFEPVEDPVVAAVLGGSPDRVAATLVAGEDRYRRGTSAWPDSRRAARRARSRMLR